MILKLIKAKELVILNFVEVDQLDCLATWQNKYQELKAFQKEYGDANPPQCHASLGIWCSTQRQDYKQAKLSPERIVLLESVSFEWRNKLGRRGMS